MGHKVIFLYKKSKLEKIRRCENEKITKTALSGLVAVTMIPAVAAPLVANAEGTQPAAEEKQIPQQIEFVLADGTVVQTSTVNLTTGAHQFSELTLPQGYELVSDGSFTVVSSADIIPVTVRAKEAVEETATVIASVQFIDADGNYAGGGNYFLPAGVQNLSILSQYVPEGYTLAEAGDFYVAPDGFYQAKVKKEEAQTVITNVQFVDAAGNAVGGGYYTLPAGVQNLSVLNQYVPEGYKLAEAGDFYVAPDGFYQAKVVKAGSSIIHVTFKSTGGKALGGGDYFVDEDGDGIANYSELQLPEGYELIQTGDFFVDANNPYTITLHKVQTHEVEQDTATLVVKYVKEGTNEVVGEDEAYTADGVKGEVHTFTVDLKAPKGYELVEDEDSLSLDVEYGQNAEVFVKVKAVEDKNEGKEDEEKTDAKEDSKKEDKGVDTGVAMPLAGIFGTMSVALGGMIALLRRKNRK